MLLLDNHASLGNVETRQTYTALRQQQHHDYWRNKRNHSFATMLVCRYVFSTFSGLFFSQQVCTCRQWPEGSDFVTLFCTLREFRVQFSHVRVFYDSRNLQKSVTQIINLGPLPMYLCEHTNGLDALEFPAILHATLCWMHRKQCLHVEFKPIVITILTGQEAQLWDQYGCLHQISEALCPDPNDEIIFESSVTWLELQLWSPLLFINNFLPSLAKAGPFHATW